MAKRGKKYLEVAQKVDRERFYTPQEAVKLVKEVSYSSFSEAAIDGVRRIDGEAGGVTSRDPRGRSTGLRRPLEKPRGDPVDIAAVPVPVAPEEEVPAVGCDGGKPFRVPRIDGRTEVPGLDPGAVLAPHTDVQVGASESP